jgi:hypothetical protein
MVRRQLLSVKEAAELLGLDERSVRVRLQNGQLKGEKRTIGLRDKWFVSAASVDHAVAKQKPFEPEALEDSAIDAETIDVGDEADARQQNWLEEERQRMRMLAEEMMTPLLHKIEALQEVVQEQKGEIVDKDRQLRLLPDLQKQAEERAKALELEHVEKEALKKQVVALQDELAAVQKPWWKKMFQSGGGGE